MDVSLQSFFREQHAREGNAHCFECGALDSSWASVTFGIYLCHVCSGKHRSLGSHVSFIRSCTMDKWRSEHLEAMKCTGGNALLERFLQQNAGPDWRLKWRNLPLGERYQQPLLLQFKDQVIAAVQSNACASSSSDGGSTRSSSSTSQSLVHTKIVANGHDKNIPSETSSCSSSSTSCTTSTSANYGVVPSTSAVSTTKSCTTEAVDIWSDKLWSMWDDDFWETPT
ncbi:unnamed protein product [Amoebophrya sp. A25]|nr:unnamed protein product [Amoebophrya sp. A25]|eukprot:GSA25T00026707001.1